MFKFLSNKDQMSGYRRKIELMANSQRNTEISNSITFVVLAENGLIDDVTATENTNLFSKWASGITYKLGAMRQYNNILYRCIQEHVSNDGLTPDTNEFLWKKVGDPLEEYPKWSQPISYNDAYSEGDKVTHSEIKWVSSNSENVQEPGISGWEKSQEQ